MACVVWQGVYRGYVQQLRAGRATVWCGRTRDILAQAIIFCEYSQEPHWCALMTEAEKVMRDYEVADVVTVLDGKYQGQTGVVVKITAKMVVLRLSCGQREVRVYQGNAKLKQRKQNDGKTCDCGDHKKSMGKDVEIVKLKMEVEILKLKLEELTNYLAKLEV